MRRWSTLTSVTSASAGRLDFTVFFPFNIWCVLTCSCCSDPFDLQTSSPGWSSWFWPRVTQDELLQLESVGCFSSLYAHLFQQMKQMKIKRFFWGGGQSEKLQKQKQQQRPSPISFLKYKPREALQLQSVSTWSQKKTSIRSRRPELGLRTLAAQQSDDGFV